MDTLNLHRKIVLNALTDYVNQRQNNVQEGIETLLIVDEHKHHYEVKTYGWRGDKHLYFTIFHFEVKPNGKIWVHANNSDYDIIEDIEAQGVPKSEIVLAFQAPSYRQFTEYALA